MSADSKPAEPRQSNLRLAWILASIAALLFVGFIVKSALFGT
ncbi:MAG: cytochrome oxidase small assembly protein [Burkholderiaceae bacterium]